MPASVGQLCTRLTLSEKSVRSALRMLIESGAVVEEHSDQELRGKRYRAVIRVGAPA